MRFSEDDAGEIATLGDILRPIGCRRQVGQTNQTDGVDGQMGVPILVTRYQIHVTVGVAAGLPDVEIRGKVIR
jgi:hypothetical protein